MNFLVSITIIIMSNIISVDYSTISVANHAKNGSNFIPQLAGEAHQLGYHKIVLDHIYYNIYKALVHTQPSIVLLPGIHTTMYRVGNQKLHL